jgi:hypothetical protein
VEDSIKVFSRMILLVVCLITFQNFHFLFSQIYEYKLLPSGGSEFDQFGSSVSISGDYAIVGSSLDDDNGEESGSAYIFKRDGSNWIEKQKLTASDGAEGDRFGTSVSISGDYAIVGAYIDDDKGVNSGSAYIFKRVGLSWTEEQKLTASDGDEDDWFGRFVSISGEYAIVSAYFNDDNGINSGSAYIFKRDGSNWIEEQKLTASDGDSDDAFGISVSISGDYAFVGAYGDDDNGINSGSAYIFKKDGSNWIEKQKLTASDGDEVDQFGRSISISGKYAIVGANYDDDNGVYYSGSAYIFERDGSNWTEEQKLTASDGDEYDHFGSSVSISGEYVIVGAYFDDDNEVNSGSAYIFRRDSSNWIEKQKLTASDGAEDDWFGFSVSISGNYAIVGSLLDDDNGVSSGSAYIYSGFVMGVDENHISFALSQNYPNPFNNSTIINYSIPNEGLVTLKVYDVLGSEVATLVNEEKTAGSYEVEFTGDGLPSGIYFYRFVAGSYIETRKMILIK